MSEPYYPRPEEKLRAAEARVAELEAENRHLRKSILNNDRDHWFQKSAHLEAEVENLRNSSGWYRKVTKRAEKAEAQLAEVKEMWEIAAEAQVERSEKAEAKVEKLREALKWATTDKVQTEAKLAEATAWREQARTAEARVAELEAGLSEQIAAHQLTAAEAERLEAKLADLEERCSSDHVDRKVHYEVEKERDHLRKSIGNSDRDYWYQKVQEQDASIERARELAEGGKFADNPGDTWRFREIARLLSGDE